MKRVSYSSRLPIQRVDVWKGRSPLLVHLDMELTERCNNNCIHCYINLPAGDTVAAGRELAVDKIKGILQEATSLGCLDVCFTGGEPLLRDDFEDIYLFSRHIGLRVLIVTNATRITPRLARLLKRVPPQKKIEVSVYGLDRESYEAVSRSPGSFEAFQAGMELLLENQVPFVARACLLPIGHDQAQAFEAWSKKIPWMDVPYAPTRSIYLRNRGEHGTKNGFIKDLRLSPSDLLAIEAKDPEKYALSLKTFCSDHCRILGDKLFGCGAGLGKACVDAYGQLQLCLMLRHPDLAYDLQQGTLRDAITTFFPKIRGIKASDPVFLERCGRCFLRSLCEQCPAVSWTENRKLDGWLEYFCEFTHAQARFIGLLGTGESAWRIPDWENRVKNLK